MVSHTTERRTGIFCRGHLEVEVLEGIARHEAALGSGVVRPAPAARDPKGAQNEAHGRPGQKGEGLGAGCTTRNHRGVVLAPAAAALAVGNFELDLSWEPEHQLLAVQDPAARLAAGGAPATPRGGLELGGHQDPAAVARAPLPGLVRHLRLGDARPPRVGHLVAELVGQVHLRHHAKHGVPDPHAPGLGLLALFGLGGAASPLGVVGQHKVQHPLGGRARSEGHVEDLGERWPAQGVGEVDLDGEGELRLGGDRLGGVQVWEQNLTRAQAHSFVEVCHQLLNLLSGQLKFLLHIELCLFNTTLPIMIDGILEQGKNVFLGIGFHGCKKDRLRLAQQLLPGGLVLL